MKLSLFVILIFAVMVSLSGCAPTISHMGGTSIPFLNKENLEHLDQEITALGKLKHPKLIKSAMKKPGPYKNSEKRVKFDTSKESNDSGIFWLSYKDFEPIFLEKCKLFHEDSAELKFIALIKDCMERNYGMFNLLYHTATKFTSYESFLSVIMYNNPTKFKDIKTVNEFLGSTFTQLLDCIMPSYNLNEYLLNLVQSMNEKTKINRKLLSKLTEADEKIQPVWNSFWDVFGTFSMDEYMQRMNEIQATIVGLEHKQIDLAQANQHLDNCLGVIMREYVPKITDTWTAAWSIKFDSLQEATKAFYGYAKKALKN